MDVKEILIDEDTSIIDAMKIIDKNGIKTIFVEKNKKLLGSLTDGDIRRWILRKGNLEEKVKLIANYKPKFLFERDKRHAAKLMKTNSIEALPIVSDDMEVISVITWNQNKNISKKDLKVPIVIMAGGLGTRLYPYTKILPKPLIPIGDVPIVEHIINRFSSFGAEKFYLIVNHKKNMIKAYFNESENKKKDYEIFYVDEDKPLGTGGGLSLLKNTIKETFILSNCDILIDEDYKKIYDFHKKKKNLITMICSLKKISIPYGVVELNNDGEIKELVEKPKVSFFTNTGGYVVEPRVIEELNDNESIGFPDVIDKYLQKGEKIGIFPISEEAWLDMGQLDEMEIMRERLELNE